MNKKLLTAMQSMSEVDYGVLGFHIQISNLCRSIMDRYELTDEQMAQHLKLTQRKFAHYKNGAYEFRISDLAQLQAIQMELGMEKLKLQIKAQVKI